MIKAKKSIGIAGTAKNTGKTTATVALLNHFHARGVDLGLTSIGYDGESIDNVTGLPKPRIYVPKGIKVVTAERCLGVSSAKIGVKEQLDINTPLGKLVCGVVEREGLLVTAGPNQSTHLKQAKHWLYENGVELVVVDGALNRISPMVETDGLILATGAAFRLDTSELAAHAHYIAKICRYPGSDGVAEKFLDSTRTIVWDQAGEILARTNQSLLEPGQLGPLQPAAARAAGFYCPGVIMPQCLKKLMQMPFPDSTNYVFADPIKTIIGNDLELVHDFLAEIDRRGGVFRYKRAVPLLAVTVNPYYPKFRYETNNYEPAFVDRDSLLANVAAKIDVPAFDIVAEGCEKLAETVVFND